MMLLLNCVNSNTLGVL